MDLPKRYHPQEAQARLPAFWQANKVYAFDPASSAPVFSIDTPPPTVSGKLHLGHVFSYSHTDFVARFWRMRGYNVFYPMGFDDNGLPTDRLVERTLGITAASVGRQAFTQACIQVSQEARQEYRALWDSLGLSIDWRYSYHTFSPEAQRLAQWSFLDLYHKGLVYRRMAPTLWCPECRTAVAQADLDDRIQPSEFVTLAFPLDTGERLTIATTRPELLPACIAVFVHPEDKRYRELVGLQAQVPLFGQRVPVLSAPEADPEIGTGAVMCCTFGDQTDVAWWYRHDLPLRQAVGPDGLLTDLAGDYAGYSITQARQAMVKALEAGDHLLARQAISHPVSVHERCDTPIEYLHTPQWFIRSLEFKGQLREAADKLEWRPAYMQARLQDWVENLSWDWCLSRQRAYGIPFPVWFCRACGEILLADEGQLPVDPRASAPASQCPCGERDFAPEEDTMDTWATSSLSPQLAGRWQGPGDVPPDGLYSLVFPFSLRPQAHEIIRTWAFYTLLKSLHHFGALPWREVAISGWGLAPEGQGKISKSKGGGPQSPAEMIAKYSSDAVRYWTASTSLGKDTRISEEKIQAGERLVTKLWNVARFSQRFLAGTPEAFEDIRVSLTPADRWILSALQGLISDVTRRFEAYDHAAAKQLLESFFWTELADNYLEMAKQRLYGPDGAQREAARFALNRTLLSLLKMFAPLFPFVTEEIYQALFRPSTGALSIHRSAWPRAAAQWADPQAEYAGRALVEIATAVRRYKSSRSLSLATPIERMQIAASEPDLQAALGDSLLDLASITRARQVELPHEVDPHLTPIESPARLNLALELRIGDLRPQARG